ncbi:hypothetical protein DJ93_1851 [Bacillus clarus]|uniref:Uncharacterized protein n=1 Tax=Bacillus clarus TaxID=2338372 RepID=A0A090Z573_9BACI|nr:hypothetical protein DJ93_1851 [Bacillus clarus]
MGKVLHIKVKEYEEKSSHTPFTLTLLGGLGE